MWRSKGFSLLNVVKSKITWLCNSRLLPGNKLHAPIAQLVEQIPLKDKVGGSIPPGRTKDTNLIKKNIFCVLLLVYAICFSIINNMAYRKNKVELTWNNNFAYIIGVIATDGNLSSDLRHIIITSKDNEMVTNCKKYLKLTNKISKTARGGSKDKKYYMLQFGDKNFFEFLLKLGLTPRKSKIMSELQIPRKYFADFFRGCIDGDGSISISKHKESKHPQYKIRLCSASNNFLIWILSSCKNFFGVTGGSISKTNKSSVYTLTFAKNDGLKILKMIYLKNVLCLSRKKKIALKILGEWRNW